MHPAALFQAYWYLTIVLRLAARDGVLFEDMNFSLSRRKVIGLIAVAPVLGSHEVIAATDSIDESGFVHVGGIDQWIAIQGRDVRNPAILYLNGGPGEAQSPFLKQFVPWEKDFTVVNWDQRSSGRTYGRNGPSTPGMATPELALETLIEDTRQVAEYVRKRLSKRKIVLVGQSWGAILGLFVVKRWPALFSAFVGTGQPVSWTKSLQAQEHWAREQATLAGDQDTLTALDATAALPTNDAKRVEVPRKYRLSSVDQDYLKRTADAFIGNPPFPTQGEVADWLTGFNFTGQRVGPLVYTFDALNIGVDVPIPYFIVQGRDDHVTSFEAARDYAALVHAPKKAFVPIAGGHWACVTNPDGFLAVLHRYVTPLATQ